MNEGMPKKEIVPEVLELRDYFNEFSYFVIAYKNDALFSSIFKIMKSNPIRTIGKYIEDTDGKEISPRLKMEKEKYPDLIESINKKVKEFNNLTESDEGKFVEIINKVHNLLYRNKTPVLEFRAENLKKV